MLKNTVYFIVIVVSMILGSQQVCFAQEKTKEELKAEREALKTELTSKETLSREKKLAKLQEKEPTMTTIQSIDGLANNSTGILIAVKGANDLLAKYKTEVSDNGNGEIDVTIHKAKLADYTKLAGELLVTSKLIADGTQQLKNAKDDAKRLSPLQARPALASVDYSSDVLQLSAEEIALQTKLVNNLIATIKASKNN
jgi:hypothetical protein